MTRHHNAPLQTKALVKRYGGLLATDHVSLSLAPGELHAIIGPNGAGKTTLIGQLGGELRPDSGDVFLQGECVTALPAAERAEAGGAPIAFFTSASGGTVAAGRFATVAAAVAAAGVTPRGVLDA